MQSVRCTLHKKCTYKLRESFIHKVTDRASAPLTSQASFTWARKMAGEHMYKNKTQKGPSFPSAPWLRLPQHNPAIISKQPTTAFNHEGTMRLSASKGDHRHQKQHAAVWEVGGGWRLAVSQQHHHQCHSTELGYSRRRRRPFSKQLNLSTY